MINYIDKYRSTLYYELGLLCFGLFLLQRISGLSLKIGTATPVLLVPAVIAVACFLREWTGFWFGLCCGVALDTVVNGTACFHTFALMLIGISAGLLFRYFFNRNIKSAVIVGTLGSLIYFIARWLFLDFLTGDSAALSILLRYHLPSALYTALFMIPFFYFVRWLAARHLIQQNEMR